MNWEFESRLNRAFQQRIYLMNIEHFPEDNTFDFLVMGASGKPYKIEMGENSMICCSCPDHSENGKLCKHLLFTLIRVLRLDRSLVYSKYYAKNRFLATPDTIKKCAEFVESQQAKNLIGKFDNQGNVKQRPIEEGDYCPICFEDLILEGENLDEKETVIFCKSTCGKSVHQSCFVKWANVKGGSCVYCKAKWIW